MPFIAGAIRDYDALFAGLPGRTRLQRLLVTHQDWTERFLDDPSFCLLIDNYPIVLADYGFRSKDEVSENCKLCAQSAPGMNA